ncbi:MAG: HAD family hydrolase [Planctomycetes bacterium]|nr:HAD family hydrolase [Planctomycetota bacterium]
MPQAIIIDAPDVLTDESANDKEAIALVRQIVATAGVRVSEQALQQAEAFAVDSFAPHEYDAMIFKLVNRDATLALRCISAFKKNFNAKPNLRKEAKALLEACKARGWKTALAAAPSAELATALQKAGAWNLLDVKGPPAAMKIELPDPRLLEFVVGLLGMMPADCALLGTRIDNDIRPAKAMRMTAIHLRVGRHGQRQLPRDLRDVPDYEAADVAGLVNLIPMVT